MAEYLRPGVFIEEVSSGVRPIEGVGTSTAAFIGRTAKGIPNAATFVSSWSQFVDRFGDHMADSYLAYAVEQFFANGGRRCYIVRVLNNATAVAATLTVPSREATAGAGASVASTALLFTALGGGTWGNNLAVRIDDAPGNPLRGFRVTVIHEGRNVEVFDNLSMDPRDDTYVESEINSDLNDPNANPTASRFVKVEVTRQKFSRASAFAQTAAALADPVPFNANETLTVEGPDGAVTTVTFPANPPRAVALQLVSTALAPLNVNAALAATNELTLTRNDTGYDRYLIVGGTATAAGRPLAGLAGFAAGQGAAIGGTLKSAPSANGFTIAAGSDVLTFQVQTANANNQVSVTLPNGLQSLATIADELNRRFVDQRANGGRGRLAARVEGPRVVVETVNRGAADSLVNVAGSAAATLGFQNLARSASTSNGLGGSEAAMVVSGEGPFAVSAGANFRVRTNNGDLSATSGDVDATITFTQGVAFRDLSEVTAAEVAAAITAAGGTNLAATVEFGRVVIRQARLGPGWSLQVIDGLGAPNVRLGFTTDIVRGRAEGDMDAANLRPATNPDLSGVNQARPLRNGDDGTPVTDTDYIGRDDQHNGLHALDRITDVNFVAIPGNTSATVISNAIGYCSARRDCFFIADAPERTGAAGSAILDAVGVRDFFLNRITVKRSYGAIYYPWLLAADPKGRGRNPRRYLPPSGFVAGLFARTDTLRGVWKAPAGTEATLTGAIALSYPTSDAEQELLNPIGVNCIRQYPASGIVVWGARTVAAQSDAEWRYVPVRRYAIYLEQSILRGTQWAVFEPNDFPLWESLKANIDDFLMGEFRRGALAGRTPDQAFSVRCDAELNPASEVNAGRVNMEVQFAPLKPAEFVIIRISQKSQRPES